MRYVIFLVGGPAIGGLLVVILAAVLSVFVAGRSPLEALSIHLGLLLLMSYFCGLIPAGFAAVLDQAAAPMPRWQRFLIVAATGYVTSYIPMHAELTSGIRPWWMNAAYGLFGLLTAIICCQLTIWWERARRRKQAGPWGKLD